MRIVEGFTVGAKVPESVLDAYDLAGAVTVKELVREAATYDRAQKGYLSRDELAKGAAEIKRRRALAFGARGRPARRGSSRSSVPAAKVLTGADLAALLREKDGTIPDWEERARRAADDSIGDFLWKYDAKVGKPPHRKRLATLPCGELQRFFISRIHEALYLSPREIRMATRRNLKRTRAWLRGSKPVSFARDSWCHATSVRGAAAIVSTANLTCEVVNGGMDCSPLHVDFSYLNSGQPAEAAANGYFNGAALVYLPEDRQIEADTNDPAFGYPLVFGGVSNSQISAIVVKPGTGVAALERALAVRELYIPVIRTDGKIVFRPDDFVRRIKELKKWRSLRELCDALESQTPATRANAAPTRPLAELEEIFVDHPREIARAGHLLALKHKGAIKAIEAELDTVRGLGYEHRQQVLRAAVAARLVSQKARASRG